MNQCPNATSFRNRVPILYQWEKQSDCQNKLREAILVNGETRVAVNSISKGEKVVILSVPVLCYCRKDVVLLDKVQTSGSGGAMGNSKANALTTGIEDDSNVLQNLKLELRITMPTDRNKAN